MCHADAKGVHTERSDPDGVSLYSVQAVSSVVVPCDHYHTSNTVVEVSTLPSDRILITSPTSCAFLQLRSPPSLRILSTAPVSSALFRDAASFSSLTPLRWSSVVSHEDGHRVQLTDTPVLTTLIFTPSLSLPFPSSLSSSAPLPSCASTSVSRWVGWTMCWQYPG